MSLTPAGLLDRWMENQTVGVLRDGKVDPVPPARTARCVAWLLARRAPLTPPRRITVLSLWLLIAAEVALDGPVTWWVHEHHGVAEAVDDAFQVLTAGLVMLICLSLIGFGFARRRRKRTR